MAQKAAPFLTFDDDPYAVVVDGHIDWILDGYTTTANYPYSQNADTQQVPSGSGLPGSYNYVRNSVKVVIDAYSGKMTFYDIDPNDPILQAYSSAFPNMFTPISKMPAQLQAHLRYPPDIFSIQSAIYGRYHLTNLGPVLRGQQRLELSPTAGAGPQSSAAGREHLQQPGPWSRPRRPACRRCTRCTRCRARTGHAGLHGLGRLRPGVAAKAPGRTTRTST